MNKKLEAAALYLVGASECVVDAEREVHEVAGTDQFNEELKRLRLELQDLGRRLYEHARQQCG